ncbi:MAG: ferrous iron transport protein B [Pseudomonadales bacterium]
MSDTAANDPQSSNNSKLPVVALVGNPNAGKTTLFNQLTGSQQRVGNWPGVTVERKTGECQIGQAPVTLVDLPGTYSLQRSSEDESLDQLIAQRYLVSGEPQLAVNIVDASSIERGLYLTRQLLDSGIAVVVALNMMDVAERQGLQIDLEELQRQLGCPVVPVVASKAIGLESLRMAIAGALATSSAAGGDFAEQTDEAEINARFEEVARISAAAVNTTNRNSVTMTDRIDQIVLNKWLAFPLFLGVMYLMFMFTINIGGAFIDVFDGVAAVLFVEAPRLVYESIGLPEWLTTVLADGLGGGVQLVAGFIPVIGSLFLFQSFLEASGYMARAAFIVDRLMRGVGLPGKSFVPLIVGFGCNVPAVMGARTMDRHGDRLLTVLMAPFMSCGARLTVYVLFASVFFPKNAENVIFALYLIGIALAVFTGLALRRHAMGSEVSAFVMELPNYHLPQLSGIVRLSWQRLKGFVMRAGKAIVAVVVVLNFVNSLGVDGSFGNQDSEQSMLSHIGKQITPAFAPMGVHEDNWPAAVGIFTGVFAKEVVVGTLDALYGSIARSEQAALDGMSAEVPDPGLGEQLMDALNTVPENLGGLNEQWGDPLGVGVGDLSDSAATAEEQGVEVTTLSVMSTLFDGPIAAFAYLLFVLLYMPCVATIGAIFKEIGGFWAGFSAAWNTILAYVVAVWCYQIGTFSEHPGSSISWILAMLLVLTASWALLIYFARKEVANSQLIPAVNL